MRNYHPCPAYAHARPSGFSETGIGETISADSEIADNGLKPSRTGAPMERNMSNPSRWVLINRFAEITGYSEDAVRHKVKNGTWSQGRIWRKAPDGRILVNLEEFERWVESGRQLAAH